jgi:hypothetical protein
MSSQLATRLPVAPGSFGSGNADTKDRWVVPVSLAKLAVLAVALFALSPAWVESMGTLVRTEPQAWGALRVVVVAGGTGLLVLGVSFLYIWVDLLKRLARQD